MKFEELTEKIIGCAYHVYNKMGYGFLESVYENCLMIEYHLLKDHNFLTPYDIVNFHNRTFQEKNMRLDALDQVQ